MSSYGCGMCGGTGQIAATLKRDKTVWAFSCSCGAAVGRNLSKLYRSWDSSQREHYDVNFEASVLYREPRPVQSPKVDYKLRTANPRDVDEDVPF